MENTAGNKWKWLHYLFLAALLLSCIASFLAFTQENKNRILNQNKEYAEEICEQTARRIEDKFEDRRSDLNILAYTVSETISEPQVSQDYLKFLQDTSNFDYVEFIDSDGINHNADGKTSDSSDRVNYINGMKGETGRQVIFHSRITNETLVNFYAPVTMDGEVIGVLNGMLREATLQDTLSKDFFGYEAKTFLCTDDGTLISFCGYDEKPVDNFLDGFEHEKLVSEETFSGIKDAFEGHKSYCFFGQGSSGRSSVSIVPVADDWMLVQTFPSAVTVQMEQNANIAGMKLEMRLVALFLIYLAYLIMARVKKHRELLSEKVRLGNIVQSLAPLFTRLAIIDYENGNYEYIQGIPSDFQAKGPLPLLKEKMAGRYISKDDAIFAEELLEWEGIKAALAEKDKLYLQYEYRIKWDTEHWENAYILTLEEKDGVPCSVILAVQDVTSLKEQEAIIQQTLRDAFHTAEDLSMAKSDFLARMSHDMRTPMNAVLGMAQVALSHLDDSSRVQDCLEKIDKSGRRLLALINEVLDMSKIESNGMVLDESPFILSDAVEEVCREASSLAEKKELRIHLDMGTIQDVNVLGDGDRLKQVLRNFLDNAIKFTPSGGSIQFKIRELTSRMPKSGYYEFVIEDTGIGMDQELQSRVFEPFIRARSYGEDLGTGLGLPIAQAIVKLMDGDISLESEVGKGTKFIIHIFLKLQDDISQPAPDNDGNAMPGNGAAGSDAVSLSVLRHAGARALLVEDNELNMEIAVEILGMAGLKAETAENGAVAVSMVQEHPAGYYDVILMDLQMPVMDGYEAAKTIRNLGREDLRRIPIIAVSANAFQENISKAKDMGMDGHVMKPIDLENLLAELDKHLP